MQMTPEVDYGKGFQSARAGMTQVSVNRRVSVYLRAIFRSAAQAYNGSVVSVLLFPAVSLHGHNHESVTRTSRQLRS